MSYMAYRRMMLTPDHTEVELLRCLCTFRGARSQHRSGLCNDQEPDMMGQRNGADISRAKCKFKQVVAAVDLEQYRQHVAYRSPVGIAQWRRQGPGTACEGKDRIPADYDDDGEAGSRKVVVDEGDSLSLVALLRSVLQGVVDFAVCSLQ